MIDYAAVAPVHGEPFAACQSTPNTVPTRPTAQRSPSLAHTGRRCRRLAAAWVLAAVVISTGAARAADPALAGITLTRAVKDSLFRLSDTDSPLLPEARADFTGLAYFEPDLAYQIEGELHRYGRPRQVPILTNTGSRIAFERFGRFVFRFGGKEFWLEIHRSLQEAELSVFFKDLTNGDQTYGAGRYAPLAELGDGRYLLDFNRAYNPYCAYNSNYVCPLPPAQNHLPFAILAGERSYGPNVAH